MLKKIKMYKYTERVVKEMCVTDQQYTPLCSCKKNQKRRLGGGKAL